MGPRLRVFLVGLTAAEVTELGRRADATAGVEIVGTALWPDVQRGMAAVPPGVDAVLLSPLVLLRRAPAPAARERDVLVEPLTPREREVLALVADGLPNRSIAAALAISEHTVKFHLASIFGKLGVSSRTEAVRRGLALNFITL